VEVIGRYSNPPRTPVNLQRLLSTACLESSDPTSERPPRQHQRRLRPEELSQLKSEYLSGVEVKQLAQRFGITRQTVIECMRREGVPRRYPKLGQEAIESYVALSFGLVARCRRWGFVRGPQHRSSSSRHARCPDAGSPGPRTPGIGTDRRFRPQEARTVGMVGPLICAPFGPLRSGVPYERYQMTCRPLYGPSHSAQAAPPRICVVSDASTCGPDRPPALALLCAPRSPPASPKPCWCLQTRASPNGNLGTTHRQSRRGLLAYPSD